MKPKNILITGNRKGIGLHLTKYYLNKGHYVFGCSRRESNLEHPNYGHKVCDVSNEKMVKATVLEMKKKFGTIDILINNAGIASLNHSLLTPGSVVDKVFTTNFYGTFFFSRECAKKMISKNNGGRIINFTTVAVPLDLDGELIYASSKSAVEKMTRIMSKELASHKITVNAIGPTPIRTDLTRVVPKVKLDELLQKQAIKRFGEFKDIENVIDFFIDDNSDFITGQIIYLGGL
jgi:3-oxoacyl-[acyl-carrier protein] reductase